MELYFSVKKKSDRVSQREGSVAEERASYYLKLHKLLKASFEMSGGTSKREKGLLPERGESESQAEEGSGPWGCLPPPDGPCRGKPGPGTDRLPKACPGKGVPLGEVNRKNAARGGTWPEVQAETEGRL